MHCIALLYCIVLLITFSLHFNVSSFMFLFTPRRSQAQLDPEELKRRQEYLREQRDKLLAMKKQAREKQLRDVAQTERPQSVKVARSIMAKGPDAGLPDRKGEEDAKKLAMRRAIADKLRQEVLNS